jgi:alkanesulfonate monooxygenase SsuD/methylene tetrahydromethanopterin reductase-like flavin-dependent oxidoreductase (luciferase family)
VITHFDSSFAGHIDIDNVGYQGTPVNDRRFPNEALVTVFDKAEAIAKTLDSLGYDRFWMAEHHFQPEGYECLPNLLLHAVHLAHVTERIKIGCGFNITPMWHPLRLAEDYAVADILTKGRVIFGVGRGYHTREVETFGAPLLDQPANRELFEEQVDIIFKAFNNESFSHHTPCRPEYRIAAMNSQNSRWCRAPYDGRWSAGSPSKVPRRAAWISWPGTASKASLAVARQTAAPCRG